MVKAIFKTLPSLACRELSAYSPDKLETVRAAFDRADSCVLGQAWLAKPEENFSPAIVRVGWYGNSLRVFAEMEATDTFTRATSHNQKMWELGDVLEIFLQPADFRGYFELHITPNNFRLQLRVPDPAALRRAQATDYFDDLMLSDEAFKSHTWAEPEANKWYVHAEIPGVLLCGSGSLQFDKPWRFSFGRYDYTGGDQIPILSSSSPHARPDFHRSEEWGTLFFDIG